jgi:hypothetical protein
MELDDFASQKTVKAFAVQCNTEEQELGVD